MPDGKTQDKKLILCCDRNWNWPNTQFSTPIVTLVRCSIPLDGAGAVQSGFYDRGLGAAGAVDKYMGSVFTKGMKKNIFNGYRYLVHHYLPDDPIYLCGFSHGSYAARVIAALVYCVGLQPKRTRY